MSFRLFSPAWEAHLRMCKGLGVRKPDFLPNSQGTAPFLSGAQFPHLCKERLGL